MRKIALALILSLCVCLCFTGCCCHNSCGHIHAVPSSDVTISFTDNGFKEVGSSQDSTGFYHYWKNPDTDAMYLCYRCCKPLCTYIAKVALVHDDGTPVLYSEWITSNLNNFVAD